MTEIKKIQISSEKTPSIYLQSINETDANDEYVQWLNDPLINQYLETRHYQQDFQSIINFIKEMETNPNEHLFTIRLRDNNKHIGNIKVGNINPHYDIADISLFIGDKDSWGKGFATQAIQLISRYSFEQLKLRKLCAGAYKPNIASTMAFIKAGYVRDGVLVEHYIFNNQPCDLVQVCLFYRQLNLLPELVITA